MAIRDIKVMKITDSRTGNPASFEDAIWATLGETAWDDHSGRLVALRHFVTNLTEILASRGVFTLSDVQKLLAAGSYEVQPVNEYHLLTMKDGGFTCACYPLTVELAESLIGKLGPEPFRPIWVANEPEVAAVIAQMTGRHLSEGATGWLLDKRVNRGESNLYS